MDVEAKKCMVVRVVSDWLLASLDGESNANAMHTKKRTILHLLLPKVFTS
jgi:hypothetical protein